MELDGRVGMIIALLVVGALYERWRSSDPFDSLQEHEHLIKRFLITKGKGSNTDPVLESERRVSVTSPSGVRSVPATARRTSCPFEQHRAALMLEITDLGGGL